MRACSSSRSITITMDSYSHVATGMQEAAAAQLGAFAFDENSVSGMGSADLP